MLDEQPIEKEGYTTFYVGSADVNPEKGIPWESCLNNSRRKLEEDNNVR